MDNLKKLVAAYELNNRTFYIWMGLPTEDNRRAFNDARERWELILGEFFTVASDEEERAWYAIFPAMCAPEKFI